MTGPSVVRIYLLILLGFGSQAVLSEEHPEQTRLDSIEKRLRVIEEDLESIVGVQDRLAEKVQANRLNWSGSLRATMNNFHLTDHSQDMVFTHLELILDNLGQPLIDPATGLPLLQSVAEQQDRELDDWYPNSWVTRLRLTMSYDINAKLRFFGTIMVFKYMNEVMQRGSDIDLYSSRYPRDTTLRVERAYFDWFITDNLVLSAGRIASPEGPPLELKENTERSATWGAQMVEAEMDAILLTYHISSSIEKTYLRLFYSPFTIHQDPVLSDDRYLFLDGGYQPMHAIGGLVETTLPGLGDNMFQLGFELIPAFTRRKLSMFFAQTGAYVEPAEGIGDSLGTYGLLNFLGELKNVAGTGLDLFAAYSLTVLRPSEGRMVYRVPLTLPVVHPQDGPTGDTASLDVPIEIGLASFEEGAGTTNLGHFFYAGARFSANLLADRPTRVGLEVNYGTKYHLAWSSPSDLLINKLSTKGLALDVYLIQELLPGNLFFRLGYLQQNKDYVGMYVGPTHAVDQTVQNLYVLLDAHW